MNSDGSIDALAHDEEFHQDVEDRENAEFWANLEWMKREYQEELDVQRYGHIQQAFEDGMAVGRARRLLEDLRDCQECGVPVPVGATICGNCIAKLYPPENWKFEKKHYRSDVIECPF